MGAANPAPHTQQQEVHSLSHDLQSLVAIQQEELSLADITERLGSRGFGLLLILFSLPSALPVPAPGYSIPFGLILFLIGLQILLQRRTPWFPRRMMAWSVSTEKVRGILHKSSRFFTLLERVIRPRFLWTSRSWLRPLSGVVVLSMALLMMVPIPLTNTLPAIVIFCCGIGMCERDGLFTMGALALGVVSISLYATIVMALWLYGPEALAWLLG